MQGAKPSRLEFINFVVREDATLNLEKGHMQWRLMSKIVRASKANAATSVNIDVSNFPDTPSAMPTVEDYTAHLHLTGISNNIHCMQLA